MATETANYKLLKPGADEFYDIGVQNENMDKIDTQIKKNADDLAAHQTEFATFKTSTEKTLNDLVSAEGLSKTRSNKDSFGTFTTMTFRRKSDNTLYGTSVLSGGTAPYYNTRTETYYDVDGVTVLKTVPYSVTYDADGEWAGDV